MTVELLQTLSLIAYIVAGVLLVVAIILFLVLNVPLLIGDLSGANARKAIESIRQQNEATGEKAYKPSAVNASRGKLTEKISGSGRLLHQSGSLRGSMGTEKISTTKLVKEAEETTLLSTASNETTILSAGSNETTILSAGMNETTVLFQEMSASLMNTADEGMTAQLSETQIMDKEQAQIARGTFTKEVEMGFVGTTEIIE